MPFSKDVSKRDWDWDDVGGEKHMPLTDLRMLRIRSVNDSDGQHSHHVLELLTPQSTKWECIKTMNGKNSEQWLQAYAEYVLQGQQP